MSLRSPVGPCDRVFRWYLESMVEGGRQLRRFAVHPLPFRVGRLSSLPLSLPSDSVSKEHAELFARGSSLYVRDLGSKNGTFVNSERVDETVLREGDILHFAQVEFRVGSQEVELGDAPEPATVSLGDATLPRQFVEGVHELPQLLRERQVTSLFQPIVSLPSGSLAGYEAFGRGRHPRLPENVHPAELESPGLVPSLARARQRSPQLRLTLEVHEGALADLETVDRLRTQLNRSGVGLAYDDFGAGQARLLELAEVPPHYLKFDMSFVRGIDQAPQTRRRLLTSLVSVARDLLVYTVAEGVETAQEADVCMRIGFTHAQGYYYGRPRPFQDA